jgi:hypothetical protein
MRHRPVMLLFAAILSLASLSVPAVLAHEDSATPASDDASTMLAEIHGGNCGHYDVENVIALSGLTQPEADLVTDAVPAAMSISTITASIQELTESPHVVVVHESAATMDEVIACGAIGGQSGPDGLAVRLDAVSTNEPVAGVAWLMPFEGQTRVAVFLSPESRPDAAIEVPVTLGGADEFAIEVSTTTFQQGQLYRFVATNEGALPHELVGPAAGRPCQQQRRRSCGGRDAPGGCDA